MSKIIVKKEKDILKVKLVLDGENWKNFIDKSENELIKNVEIKGFRKGNAPREVALKNIKVTDIHAKAIDFAVDSNFEKVIEEMKKHKIITKPHLTIDEVSNKTATLSFESHLSPDIKLPNYLNFKVEYKEKVITEKDISDEFNKFKELFKVKKSIENKEHKIVLGDDTKIDFVGKINGKKFENGSSKDYELKIGSKKFIKGFEEQLIGLKIGDKKEVKVTFPNTYPEKSLAGKEATFDVEIKDITLSEEISKEKLLERINKIGFKSVEDFKEKIKEMLVEQAKQKATDIFIGKLISMIIDHKDTEINIPKQLLDDEIEHQFKHFKENLIKQNVKVEDYFKMLQTDEKKFKKENLSSAAEKNVKDGLIYARLVEENNIKEISEEEFEKEYSRLAALQQMKIEDVKKQITLERLNDSLIFLKLVDLLKEKLNK
ncbi:MAG: trigger factor [Candidatus Hepatoplasma vulgare]|nr:MAG: trigger factor [Candidatus Hepatoplasma sp.]